MQFATIPYSATCPPCPLLSLLVLVSVSVLYHIDQGLTHPVPLPPPSPLQGKAPTLTPLPTGPASTSGPPWHCHHSHSRPPKKAAPSAHLEGLLLTLPVPHSSLVLVSVSPLYHINQGPTQKLLPLVLDSCCEPVLAMSWLQQRHVPHLPWTCHSKHRTSWCQ